MDKGVTYSIVVTINGKLLEYKNVTKERLASIIHEAASRGVKYAVREDGALILQGKRVCQNRMRELNCELMIIK